MCSKCRIPFPVVQLSCSTKRNALSFTELSCVVARIKERESEREPNGCSVRSIRSSAVVDQILLWSLMGESGTDRGSSLENCTERANVVPTMWCSPNQGRYNRRKQQLLEYIEKLQYCSPKSTNSGIPTQSSFFSI
jgi:hypothetical protein